MNRILQNQHFIRVIQCRSKTFVTTPIFYVNASPHIGHVYSTVIADAVVRYDKIKNPSSNVNDHILLTGTDEHGIKIQRASEIAKKPPQQFCDDISKNFKNVFDHFDIGYTHFGRTSKDYHKNYVQRMWKNLDEKGYIYKDKYSGYYSSVDEAFYQEKDIEEVKNQGKHILISKETKSEVQYVEEDNYMFKLSNFYPEVEKWIINNDVIRPKHYINQILKYMEMKEDLSISRDSKRMSWGIPVPNDSSQTIYVWLDALMNYISTVSYRNKSCNQWPPSWQIIGKDIMKFHAIYWPAFLLAADLELPQKIFIHGHWTVDNIKMSKSIGNIVDPYEMSGILTPDGLRYFLLKQGVPDCDNNFSKLKTINIINADMINNIGNLLTRSTGKNLNSDGMYFPKEYDTLNYSVLDNSKELIEDLKNICEKTQIHFDNLLFYKGLEEIMIVCKKANAFFQHAEPWKKERGHELSTILYITYETLRVIGILLQPIIPKYTSNLLNQLGIEIDKRNLSDAIINVNNIRKEPLGKNLKHIMKRIDIVKK